MDRQTDEQTFAILESLLQLNMLLCRYGDFYSVLMGLICMWDIQFIFLFSSYFESG